MADLDAILDAALDEYDAPAPTPAPAAAGVGATRTAAAAAPPAAATGALSPPPAAHPPPAGPDDPAAVAAFQAFLHAMASGEGIGGGGVDAAAAGAPNAEQLAEMHREMNAMLQQMAEAAGTQPAPATAQSSAASSTAVASTAGTPAASASASGSSTSADPIADAIRMIADGARTMPAGGPAGMDDAGMEAMLQKLMAEMGGGADGLGALTGQESDADMEAMVQKMMGGMLSKEYLYQPMKDIAEKYPAYIREHEATLAPDVIANFRKQQSCFERIVAAFENDPQPTMKVMELMNEMQQYGTPPKELVNDFTPPGFDPSQPMPPGMAALAGLTEPPAGGAAAAGAPSPAELEALKKMSDEACKMQ